MYNILNVFFTNSIIALEIHYFMALVNHEWIRETVFLIQFNIIYRVLKTLKPYGNPN